MKDLSAAGACDELVADLRGRGIQVDALLNNAGFAQYGPFALGSIGSFSPAPMTGAYAATKAYVLSLSLALTEELKGTGVTVTALCPGPTATGFQARAEMADSKLIAGRSLDPAEDVVRAGYAAMKNGRP